MLIIKKCYMEIVKLTLTKIRNNMSSNGRKKVKLFITSEFYKLRHAKSLLVQNAKFCDLYFIIIQKNVIFISLFITHLEQKPLWNNLLHYKHQKARPAQKTDYA